MMGEKITFYLLASTHIAVIFCFQRHKYLFVVQFNRKIYAVTGRGKRGRNLALLKTILKFL